MKTILYKFFKNTYEFLSRTPLRKVPGMLLISNLIFRFVWPNRDIIEVQGNKMVVNVNDPNPNLRKTFQAYAMDQVHEETTTKLFKHIIKEGDTVVDLGANIGYFSIIAAKKSGPKGKVLSFEPEPNNFKYLKKNIEVNDFENVTPIQGAISDKNGEIDLFICEYDSGHHTINQFQGIEAIARGRKSKEKTIKIKTWKLDDYLNNQNVKSVDVMKIDIEGSEGLALKGMQKTLKLPGINIFIEYYPALLKSMGTDLKLHIESLLNDYGFKVYAIGQEYDLLNAEKALILIESFNQLGALLSNENDHINLFLTKKDIKDIVNII